MLKKILFSLLALVMVFILWNYSSVWYGLNQAAGQAKVLWNSVDLEELKNDPGCPDSILQKINYIEAVRDFASEKLGLNESENYTSYYDQNGEAILWVVTASPEFEIKSHTWHFPIAGTFPYKGFFEFEKAKAEENVLREKGFDTDIDEVSAWSTLGWFRDPILSSMLSRSEGSLAELIIHELTHATIYYKNKGEFNENLANFIGKEGARLFLLDYFYPDTSLAHQYEKSLNRKKRFAKFMRIERNKLIAVYDQFPKDMKIEEKRALKTKQINQIKQNLIDSLYQNESESRRNYWMNATLNNAFFTGFGTYSNKQDSLRTILASQYDGDLYQLVNELKNK